MIHSVPIENDAIAIEVWPQLGGKVSSVIDKADRFELLYNYPSELPDGPMYDTQYSSSWFAGWDECFPAVGPGKYPGHPYDGIGIPDHGELWGLPTTAVPTKNGITTVWHGLRFGYRLTRKLYLADASIVSEYTLTNLAPFPFSFVWAQHALLSMSSPVELHVPQQPFKLSHGSMSDVQRPIDWPMCDGMNLSRPTELPARHAWKIFALSPIDQPLTVRYPSRGRSLVMSYWSDDQLPAYWAAWINTGAMAGQKNFAIEPTTGRFDQLERSLNDHSAGTLAPLARRTWTVKWDLGRLQQ